MFHVVIMLIATCFGCTLYYFYAFSGTNLLTRCQSASSLFSAVFGFRNPTRKISSELHEIFSAINVSSGSFRSPKGTWGGAPRAPHPSRARPKVGPSHSTRPGPAGDARRGYLVPRNSVWRAYCTSTQCFRGVIHSVAQESGMARGYIKPLTPSCVRERPGTTSFPPAKP